MRVLVFPEPALAETKAEIEGSAATCWAPCAMGALIHPPLRRCSTTRKPGRDGRSRWRTDARIAALCGRCKVGRATRSVRSAREGRLGLALLQPGCFRRLRLL